MGRHQEVRVACASPFLGDGVNLMTFDAVYTERGVVDCKLMESRILPGLRLSLTEAGVTLCAVPVPEGPAHLRRLVETANGIPERVFRGEHLDTHTSNPIRPAVTIDTAKIAIFPVTRDLVHRTGVGGRQAPGRHGIEVATDVDMQGEFRAQMAGVAEVVVLFEPIRDPPTRSCRRDSHDCQNPRNRSTSPSHSPDQVEYSDAPRNHSA